MIVSLRNRPAVLTNELPHVDWSHSHLRLYRSVPAADLTADDPFAAVPACLREIAQWVCWTYVVRNGRKTKCPISPTSGRNASSTDPATWGTFEQALARWGSFPGMNGIGFVFTAEDEFCGIDLDHCIIDGVVVPAAQAIVDQFSTYTEISPSGAGLKLFIKGKKPVGAGCRSDVVEDFDHAEVYDNKRFFTVTGRALKGTPRAIAHRQNQLDEFCERLWPSASKRAGSNRIYPTTGPLVIPDIAERERRCLKYIEKCPDAISGDGGHDSTLRAACECYRFGLDDEAAMRVMRFFNQSKTCGEVWSDYEIKHKLESARRLVQEEGQWECRLKDSATPKSCGEPPDVAVLTSDIGNAKRLLKRFGDRIRFCFGINKWLVWDGRRWRFDDRGMVVNFCKKTALAILDEAKGASGHAQEELLKWAMASQKRERLTAMAALAQPDVAVTPDDLDIDPWAFNCLNGTVDLRSGKSREHRKEDLLTKLSPVEFDPAATCPRFERFLHEVFGAQPELIAFVQRWHGHCLTADVREQYLVIYHGEGNNGKNVLLDTVAGIMGDHACEAPPDLLVVRRNPEHPTEIADLLGRRLVVASETERDGELRIQLMKRLTGNDRLKGRFMRRDYFEFTRTHKLILVTNNKPVIRENTEAVWRRIRLVPFAIVIPKHARDTGLLRQLRSEWPGILAWMVRGCVAWLREGLPEPETVVMATDEYRKCANSFDAFAESRCRFGPAYRCSTTALVSAYGTWCDTNNRVQLQGKALAKALRDRNCSDERLNGGRYWFGITLDSP